MTSISDPPFISIVVAALPDQVGLHSLQALKSLKYPKERFEVVVTRGRQPSIQRNQAVERARGEWIYFLDDDSRPDPDALNRAVSHLSTPRLAGVGGPNLCPAEAPVLQQTFAAVLAHPLAFGPSAARYAPVGSFRVSSEKELILCNLLLNKEAFQKAGGFDEVLYPNEENALLDAIQAQGKQIYYDPAFQVRRLPRSRLKDFFKMLFRYGRGRAEQVRRHPTWGSLPNFVPAFFCLYLLIYPWLPGYCQVGLALYAAVVLAGILKPLFPEKANRVGLMGLIMATHILYGLGIWWGLFTRLSGQDIDRKRTEVSIEVLDPTTL